VRLPWVQENLGRGFAGGKREDSLYPTACFEIYNINIEEPGRVIP
jgi:hypothetical protein